MHTEFEVEVDTFDDEDLETTYWFNKLVPKRLREKGFKVNRNRPRENDED